MCASHEGDFTLIGSTRRWRCLHSRRWLPGDHVNDLAMGPDGAVWVATNGGVTRLRGEQMTLEEKARRNGTESLDALLFLETVTGLPGFIARSYMPAGQGP